jgi:DNA polymerase-3 subunit delta'
MLLRDIIGHRRLATLLARAIERESLPPTLLFAGPPGVGKWAMARATAQAVNCLEPVSTPTDYLAVDACGKCRGCDRVARGVHVDVITMEPDDRASIKIDVVRDVLGRTSFRPFEGKRRLVMIREADTLEPQAQNSLLKSLEEPPPGTMFILTTAVPGALLPTVRSRCMRLRFGRLTSAEVSMALMRDHEHSESEAREAAPLADGSIGQALALADNDLTSLRDAALLLLRHAAGRADVQSRVQAAATLYGGSAKKERSREDLAVVLRLMASIAGDLEPLARAFTGDRARDAFGAVDRALTALERNAGTKVVSEWLAVQV